MFEEYIGRFICFFLKPNQSLTGDISGVVSDVKFETLPNQQTEIIFVLDTGEEDQYEIPYSNVSFMRVSIEKRGVAVPATSEPASTSLGMPSKPSDLIEGGGLSTRRNRDATPKTPAPEASVPAETQAEEAPNPAQVNETSMQID